MPDQQTLESQTERQIELEKLFNNNQLMPRIRREFTDCTEFDDAVERARTAIAKAKEA
jgi:HKD family nuclease